VSPFAETIATCEIFYLLETGIENSLSLLVISLTALSIPLFNSIGFAPAVTFFKPVLKIAYAKTVPVVVPSPATIAVLPATSLSICAPIC
jgi:hypothetical protein